MYNFLSKFILRTPYFYYDLLEKKDFKYLINDKIFKEAIFLASPDLYTAMINISNKSYKKQTRIKNSLYRYAERMSTRCTPEWAIENRERSEKKDFSLLTGLSGILLVIMSIVYNDNQKWDSLFLLS